MVRCSISGASVLDDAIFSLFLREFFYNFEGTLEGEKKLGLNDLLCGLRLNPRKQAPGPLAVVLPVVLIASPS